MKIVIIDRDAKTRYHLQQIISAKGAFGVVGMFDKWDEAFPRIAMDGADTVVTGLVPPQLESLQMLIKAKSRFADISFVVLVQGYDKELIRLAYENGVDFVLHKPVCEVEMKHTLQTVEMTRLMRRLLNMAGAEFCTFPFKPAGRSHSDGQQVCSLFLTRLKGILRDIGILSEAGSRDIINIAWYLTEHQLDFQEITLKELCSRMEQNTKSVEQRIRRAALTGLTNLANRGLEDYADPAFNEYAGTLYQLDQVRQEINYIMGKSERHGCVRVRKFLLSLFEYC